MSDLYKRRLSVELTEEQYQGLAKYIPWGLQKPLFSAIVDDLLDVFKNSDSNEVIGAMLAGIIRPRDLLKTLPQEDQDGNFIGSGG